MNLKNSISENSSISTNLNIRSQSPGFNRSQSPIRLTSSPSPIRSLNSLSPSLNTLSPSLNTLSPSLNNSFNRVSPRHIKSFSQTSGRLSINNGVSNGVNNGVSTNLNIVNNSGTVGINTSINKEVLVERSDYEYYKYILEHYIEDLNDPLYGIKNIHLSKRYKDAKLLSTATIYDAALLLNKRYNRIAIVNEKDEIVGIVSQSAIVKHFLQHAETFPLLETRISALLVNRPPVICVNDTDKAYRVFHKMADLNISGVPIINDENRWVAVTTGSDLKLFVNKPSAELLKLPIISFLSKTRESDQNEKSVTIGVHSDSTLFDVIKKLAIAKIHRLFVCEENAYPEGVVSYTDILEFLMKNIE